MVTQTLGVNLEKRKAKLSEEGDDVVFYFWVTIKEICAEKNNSKTWILYKKIQFYN